jgi:hypothetical protein
MMQVRKLRGSDEAHNVHYLRKSVLSYLNGDYDWKWVMAIIKQSGLGKREVLALLRPLKNHGWKFRSQTLFAWLQS